MGDMLKLIWWAVIKLFRSTVSLEAEILTLRRTRRSNSRPRPPLNSFEMSCADRNFADLGTKLLAIQPLGLQVVDPQDSVLASRRVL